VKTFVIFLNELSFACALSPEAMRPHVLSTLATVRAARRIRSDIVVAGNVPLSSVFLGDGTHSIGAVLRGDANRDEWRFLRGLDQSSPWSSHPGSTRSGDFEEITFDGQIAVGMLWAKQNESAIVSFPFPPIWADSSVPAVFHKMDEASNIDSSEVAIPNLSTPEHAEVHRRLIENYGRTVSASSLIYEGDGFFVRIWFHDHDPPHFHVLMRRDTSDTVAKYVIETLDLMEGQLPSSVRKKVEEWARGRTEELMRSWHRCRAGLHPFVVYE
jgi:Domain of unknown function (DUF4160)